MPTHEFVLANVENGVWIESFDLEPSAQLELAGSDRWSVTKRRLHGGLSDGIDVVTLDNGELSLSVLPTRGMGIWKGQYHDTELSWKSPVAFPVNPSFVDLFDRQGLGWLNGFNELLCRCGLSWNGPPGMDAVEDEDGNSTESELTLHGRVANLPAHSVVLKVVTEGKGSISVTGVVDETSMFGPWLRLTSTVTLQAGSNEFVVEDRVTNMGGTVAECQLLYHTNVGQPFLGADSRFVAPIRQVAPRDERAAEGIGDYSTYRGPEAGYAEQVYYMDLKPDSSGESSVLLRNSAGDKGLKLSYTTGPLPCFALWKNTQCEADGYVTGLEPATNFPNFKSFERRQSRVLNLKPNESHECRLRFAVYDSADDVSRVEGEILNLQGNSHPQVFDEPRPEWSDVGA